MRTPLRQAPATYAFNEGPASPWSVRVEWKTDEQKTHHFVEAHRVSRTSILGFSYVPPVA